MDVVKSSRMDKRVFSVKPLEAHADEKAYWASKSPQERLEALEFMRQVMYGYDPTTARLQRVLTVDQQPWSRASRS
jgi:hypothetical protein